MKASDCVRAELFPFYLLVLIAYTNFIANDKSFFGNCNESSTHELSYIFGFPLCHAYLKWIVCSLTWFKRMLATEFDHLQLQNRAEGSEPVISFPTNPSTVPLWKFGTFDVSIIATERICESRSLMLFLHWDAWKTKGSFLNRSSIDGLQGKLFIPTVYTFTTFMCLHGSFNATKDLGAWASFEVSSTCTSREEHEFHLGKSAIELGYATNHYLPNPLEKENDISRLTYALPFYIWVWMPCIPTRMLRWSSSCRRRHSHGFE